MLCRVELTCSQGAEVLIRCSMAYSCQVSILPASWLWRTDIRWPSSAGSSSRRDASQPHPISVLDTLISKAFSCCFVRPFDWARCIQIPPCSVRLLSGSVTNGQQNSDDWGSGLSNIISEPRPHVLCMMRFSIYISLLTRPSLYPKPGLNSSSSSSSSSPSLSLSLSLASRDHTGRLTNRGDTDRLFNDCHDGLAWRCEAMGRHILPSPASRCQVSTQGDLIMRWHVDATSPLQHKWREQLHYMAGRMHLIHPNLCSALTQIQSSWKLYHPWAPCKHLEYRQASCLQLASSHLASEVATVLYADW